MAIEGHFAKEACLDLFFVTDMYNSAWITSTHTFLQNAANDG
jgi:hypothetical protein